MSVDTWLTKIIIMGRLSFWRNCGWGSEPQKSEIKQVSKGQIATVYVLIDWVGGPDGKIFGPRSWRTDLTQSISILLYDHRNLPIFFFSLFRVIKFGMFTYVAHFDWKVGIYIATKLFWFASRARYIDKIPVWGSYAILAGPDGFFRPCSRHHVRPSYGNFLNSFAMKARAGPYGSYNKTAFWTGMASLTTSEGIKTDQCIKGRWFSWQHEAYFMLGCRQQLPWKRLYRWSLNALLLLPWQPF